MTDARGGDARGTSTVTGPGDRRPGGGPAPYVWFVGAGPGAADLLTFRAARALAAADVVIWASSLVNAEILAHTREGAEVLDSKGMTLEEVVERYRVAAARSETVARVHSGDPGLYGAVHEQIAALEDLGVAWEIIPGVSSVAAAAAAAGRELTVPEVAQSVICTRLAGRTPVPAGEGVAGLAAHGTTMALLLSASRPRRLQGELLAGGYPPETPCVVAYRVTWPEERIQGCPLGELAATLQRMGVRRHTLVLVGPALAAGGTRSHLYDPAFTHSHRQGVPP